MTDPQTWNMYGYVRNNPMTLVDPSGLDETDCTSDASCEDPCDYDPSSCGGIGWPGGGGGSSGSGQPQGGIVPYPGPIPTPGTGAANSLQGTPSVGAPPTPLVQPTVVPLTLGDIFFSTVARGAGLLLAILLSPSETQQGEAEWLKGRVPPVEYIEARCTAVGPPVIVPSTKRGNKGGKSIEQEYICPGDPQPYTVHTLTDPNGRPIDKHARPGKPKYGGSGAY
jgi:hypothetical protein